MALDVQSLQRELDELRKERSQAKERLNAFKFGSQPGAGPSSASGRMGPPGSGPGMRAGGPGWSRDDRDSFPRAGSREINGRHGGAGDARLPHGPGLGPRGSVFARLGSGMHAHPDRAGPSRHSSSAMADGPDRGPSGSRGLDRRHSQEIHAAAAPRKRILSAAVAVAVDGEQQDSRGDGEGAGAAPAAAPVGSKRVAAEGAAEDGGMRKRNRRMFGALMGTLQKFREEDQQFQSTDTAQRRQEMQRKAEERAKEESERLRKAAYEQRTQQRQSEIQKLQSVNLAADIKVLEILYAKKIQRREQLGHFLCTKTSPPVYWQPAEHNATTQELAKKQDEELQLWKAEMLAELEREREGLRQRMATRQEEAARRRQEVAEGRQPRAGGEDGAGDGKRAGGKDDGGEGEPEQEEELEAGEYDAEEDGQAEAAQQPEEGAEKPGPDGGASDGSDHHAPARNGTAAQHGDAERGLEVDGEGGRGAGEDEGEEQAAGAGKPATDADTVEDLLND